MNSPSCVTVAMVRRLWAERDKAIRWRLLTDMDDSCISLSVSAHTPIKGLDFHLLDWSRVSLDVLLYKACHFTMWFTSRTVIGLWNVTFSMYYNFKEPVHSKMNTVMIYSSSCQFKPLRLSIIKDVSHYVHAAKEGWSSSENLRLQYIPGFLFLCVRNTPMLFVDFRLIRMCQV